MAPTLSRENFEKFRVLVLSRVELQKPLREIVDREEFIASVVELGSVNGYEFSVQDVEDAIARNRRDWLERWV